MSKMKLDVSERVSAHEDLGLEPPPADATAEGWSEWLSNHAVSFPKRLGKAKE